jgi:hypothetical protein
LADDRIVCLADDPDGHAVIHWIERWLLLAGEHLAAHDGRRDPFPSESLVHPGREGRELLLIRHVHAP